MTSYSRAAACALLLALSSGLVVTTGASAAPFVRAEEPTPQATDDSGSDLALATGELQTDLTEMRSVQDEAEARYREAKAKADRLRRVVASNQAAADQARLIVGQYARQMYMSGPTDLSLLASVIDTETPEDLMQHADEAQRVGNHKDDQYNDAVALLKRNQEMQSAADTAQLAAQASMQSIENQMLGLRRQLADGVGAWAKHLAGEATLFNAEQATRNSDAAAAWAAYLGKLADWKVPSVTSQDLLKRRLPRSLKQFRNNPGIAYFRDGDKEAEVVPERVVASVTYAVSKLGTAYQWRRNTETKMECSALLDRAWQIPSIPTDKRTDERELVEGGVAGLAARTRLVPTDKLSIGDVVFLDDPGRGVNHAGIVLDSGTMIAADSSTGAVNALDIPADRVWHVGRSSLKAPKKDNALPRVTKKQFQCGADPAAFIKLPDGATLSDPDLCPPSAAFGEAHMQDPAIRVGRCAAAIWPVLQTIGGWRPSDPYPDHPSGRAVDIMMPGGCATDAANVSVGTQIAEFFMKNADKFDVQYIIWHQRIWTAGSPPTAAAQWRGMSNRGGCTANHMDHVHVTVNGPNVAPGVPEPVEPPAPVATDEGGNPADGDKKNKKDDTSGKGSSDKGAKGDVPAPEPDRSGDKKSGKTTGSTDNNR